MPTNSLVEFIIYVIPGFLVVEIYHAAYPAKEKSEFQIVGWSILYGLLIVTIVKWSDKNIFSYALNTQCEGIPELKFTIVLLFTGLIGGLVLVLFYKSRFYLSNKSKYLKHLAPDPQSIWAKINQPDNKDWCVIFLDDGAIYLGYIAQYTFDPDKDDQDFLLGNAKRVNEKLEEEYIVTGIGVYLNTKNVKRIEFLKGQ
jgi:hypothetical protein